MTTTAEPSGRAAEASPPHEAAFTRGYRRYALSVLLLIYIFNFLDRQIVSILAEPIRNDLGLADWQLGVMTGLAFALFYTVLGFPVARVAERGDRPLIIATAVAVWSAFTAICGLAQNFWQLILARVGVGVGEAGCTPPAVSLIADYTPKEERASAMSFYAVGSPIGALLGMVIGGLVADAWGWRAAFFIVGTPGLLLAVVAATTLREPRRRLKAELAAQAQATPPLREALNEIRRSRALWRLIFGGAVKSFMSFGMTAFLGSFFFRNHGEAIAALAQRIGLEAIGFVGLALGLTVGVAGAIGAVTGGKLVDHFAKRDVRAYARIPALGFLLGVPFYAAALLSDSVVWAFVLLMIPSMLGSFWNGPIYGAIQGLVRPRVRATATASLLFTTNLIGLGLGPLGVGVVSDLISNVLHLGPAAGVKWSILLFTLLGIPAALIYWSAAKTLREELVH
jgi:MFS family permease